MATEINGARVAVQAQQHVLKHGIHAQALQQIEQVAPNDCDVGLKKIALRAIERLRDTIREAVENVSVDREGCDKRMHRDSRVASMVMQQLLDSNVKEGEPLQGESVDPDATGLVWGSHSEFYAMIAALLDVLKSEWLNKYQDGMAQFLDFYKEFSDIMEKLKPISSDDKGAVKIDFAATVKSLRKLIAKYSLKENALAEFKTREEADRFAASFGLPGLTVKTVDGKSYVYMDLSNVQQLIEDMPVNKDKSPIEWDSARYNAWVSSRDSNLEQIKHMSKVFGEKLSEMMQKFDSIAKILSSTIEKISESDNNFVRF